MKRTVSKTKPSTGGHRIKNQAHYRGTTEHATDPRTEHATEPQMYYTLSRAAKYLQVSKTILFRAHQQGFLKFKRVNWVLQIPFMKLITAPVFTIGHAARKIGIHYETAREWVAKGWLKPVTVGHCRVNPQRRVSYVEIELAKKRRQGH